MTTLPLSGSTGLYGHPPAVPPRSLRYLEWRQVMSAVGERSRFQGKFQGFPVDLMRYPENSYTRAGVVFQIRLRPSRVVSQKAETLGEAIAECCELIQQEQEQVLARGSRR